MIGSGLINIRERVHEVNGTVAFESETGFKTSIYIPLTEQRK